MLTSRVHQLLAAVLSEHRTNGRGRTLPDVLCEACAAQLPVSGVGMILMGQTGPEVLVAATDGPATVLEQLQLSLGEGACVDASTWGRPVLQPDLRRTGPGRWPGFGPAALEAGIEAVFAFPLQVGGIRLGVLDLYRDVPGTLGAAELREALSFADAATWVVLHLQEQMRSHPVGALHPDLTDHDQHRPAVHQATGMISVQAAVGLVEALLLLRARAYATDRGILEVARDVLSRRLRFTPEAGMNPVD